MRTRRRPSTPDIAVEIVRRVTAAQAGRPLYVVRLSDPPTLQERLQLIAARLQRTPVVRMPHKYIMEEWVARYGRLKDC
jgi:hypothetical protein